MASHNDRHSELHTLTSAMLDRTLDEQGKTRLGELLATDPDARQFYYDYVRMQTLLEVAHAPLLPVGPSETDKLSLPQESKEGTTRHSRKSLLSWASRHPKVPAIAVAATLLIAALVVMGLVPVKEWVAGGKAKPEESDPTEKKEFVARLSNWQNDVWLDDTRPPLDDPRLKTGKRLVIDAGLIEVTYMSGARVVIEGPAEYWVTGKKNGQLELGSLVARVSEETAKGFAVDTPFTRVEDLGTEFGVEVRESGAEEILVLTGEVDVVRDMGDGMEQRVRLTKDQGAFISAQRREITRRAKVDSRLAAVLRNRLDAFDRAATPGELAELEDALLRVDLQNSRGQSVPGVTQPRFVALDNSHVTDAGTARATYKTDVGELTVTLTGLDQFHTGFFNRPQSAANDARIAMASLYGDFAFANGESPQSLTLTISGEGIAADTEYRVTFFSYDCDDTQGEHSVTFAGASGTIGAAGPLRYTGGDHPKTGGQYAVTGTFTADGAGVLTVEMKDSYSADAQSNTGVRLNAFALSAVPLARNSEESGPTARAEELESPEAKDPSENRAPSSENGKEARKQDNTNSSEELASGR